MYVELTKERIDAIFEEYTNREDETANQGNVLLTLYKVVFGEDWTPFRGVDGYPKVNEMTWKYICGKFQTFDKMHHPEVLPGGRWMNTGFSSRDELPDWVVEPCGVLVGNEAVSYEDIKAKLVFGDE